MSHAQAKADLYGKSGYNGEQVGGDRDSSICVAPQHLLQNMPQVQGSILRPRLHTTCQVTAATQHMKHRRAKFEQGYTSSAANAQLVQYMSCQAI